MALSFSGIFFSPFNISSVFLFLIYFPSSTVFNTLATFVSLIVESSRLYHTKCRFFLRPKLLVNHANSAWLISSNCNTVGRYFLVRVGVIKAAFLKLCTFLVILAICPILSNNNFLLERHTDCIS